MHKEKVIKTITIVLGILSFICLVGYFLALHDIFRDYASPKVLRDHAGITPGSLPSWTTCDLEWGVIYLGFLPVLIFHVLFFVGLFWRARGSRARTPNKTLFSARGIKPENDACAPRRAGGGAGGAAVRRVAVPDCGGRCFGP